MEKYHRDEKFTFWYGELGANITIRTIDEAVEIEELDEDKEIHLVMIDKVEIPHVIRALQSCYETLCSTEQEAKERLDDI
jgi:hypothetical protein